MSCADSHYHTGARESPAAERQETTSLMDSAFRDWLKSVRREFHMHPETGYQEKWTTRRILELLEEIGLEAQGFDDVTGATGLIRCADDCGPCIALRADIDALPLEELNDVPYKSLNKGKMHACGHDAHATILLGVAKNLMESNFVSQNRGSVKFIFQPAEEGGAGAKAMIEKGVMEGPRVEVILAGHVQPEIPVGDIGIFRSQALASADIFNLTLTGKGTHGAHPDMGNDPILAGAHFTTALHSVVSRNVNPVEAAALSIGAFHAGTASNIIPETVRITGTIRALEADIRALLHKRLHELVEGIAVTFNVKAEINIEAGYPATDNDPKVSGFLFQTAADTFGADRVAYQKPVLGAEDFGYFSRMRPGAMISIGCGNEDVSAPLHSPHFDLDEKALETGVLLFSEAVRRFLKGGL